MLSAEAVRLVAIEILCPTASLVSGSGFPTLAGRRVFDSRSAALSEIDRDRTYTPVISLYTRRSGANPRGEASSFIDTAATTVLEVVAELAVVARDPDARPGIDPDYVDAMADGDPVARLVLGALAGQIRALLTQQSAGLAWRKLVRQVNGYSEETFAIPEFGLRYQRLSLVFELSIQDDDFDLTNGGLPEPLRSVHAALPDESYAKAKLGELSAHFLCEPLAPPCSINGTANLPGHETLQTGFGELPAP